MDCCGSEPIYGTLQLKVSGAATCFFSIISFGIAIAINDYLSNLKLGLWYIAFISFVAGACGVFPASRGAVVSACVFSAIAVFLGVIGCFVNGIASGVIHGLKACYNPYIDITSIQYGGENSGQLAYNCSVAHSDKSVDCYCADHNDKCTYFDGESDCSTLYGHYASMLSAATAFNVFTLVAVTTLSIYTCCSLCCPHHLGAPSDQGNAGVIMVNNDPIAMAQTGTAPAQVVVIHHNVYSANPQNSHQGIVHAEPVFADPGKRFS